MIADALDFLKASLNAALPRDPTGAPAEELFVYAGTSKEDAVSFRADAVSILLVRIEEEKTLRPPDLYSANGAPGEPPRRVEPEIRMNLYVLFVARFGDNYGEALRRLSALIGYFQKHRLFNAENAPTLSPGIHQLWMELVTMSFSEQSELWGSLRAAYHPSAMYRVKAVAFADEAGEALPQVKTISRTVVQTAP